MERILITGGAGFIGSHLARHLRANGYKVTILDSLSDQIHGESPFESAVYKELKEQTEFIVGNVTNKNDWIKALVNQDAVIHLAAETGTGQSMYEIEKYVTNNITATSILWDILANTKHGIKKIVIASSRAIYGEGKYWCKEHKEVYPLARKDKDMLGGDFNVKCPFCNSNVDLLATTEDSKIHPTSIYGFTKQAQEEMSLIAGKSLQIPVTALRYQNVYGPGQSLANPYTGILSIFSTRIKNGNDILIFEDGKESRDFVYIDDVVTATTLSLESEASNFESFNVGTGVRTDVLTVAKTLAKLYTAKSDIKISGNYRLGDIRDNYADISKIKKILGYSAKWNFNDGITKFVNWVNEQNIQNDKYDLSIAEMKRKGLFK